MITNATLVSIGTPGPASTGGDIGSLTTQSVGARCLSDQPTRSQIVALASLINGATAVIYVAKSRMPGVSISPLQILTIKIDGGSTVSLEVQYVRDRQLQGALAHWECFAKDVT